MNIHVIKKFIPTIWSEFKYRGLPLREFLSIRSNMLSKTLIRYTIDANKETAYTFLSKDVYHVVLGGEMIRGIANLPEKITSKKAIEAHLRPTIYAINGLAFHELGHNLFTDMRSRDIIDYPKKEYINFLHTLVNIIEDPVVEANIVNLWSYKYPRDVSPKVYFNQIIEAIFKDQGEIYKDHEDVGSFMNYILLKLRLGKTFTKTNKVYEAHKAELTKRLLEVISTKNATARLKAEIALGEWIIENIKELDFKSVEEPEEKVSKGIGMPGAMDSTASFSGDGLTASKSGSTTPEESADEKDEEAEGEKAEDGKDEETESPDTAESITLDDDFTSMLSSDGLLEHDHHEWVFAKDEVSYDESVVQDIDKILGEVADPAKEIAKYLTLINGRKKPRMAHGFTTGKLNIRAAMQDDIRDGCNLKLFDRDVRRGKQADVAVWLLGDNSGSMDGRKAGIASRAMLALAQACDWAKIPCCVSCFTKTNDSIDGTCVTVIEKGFEDSFESSKPFFGINSRDTISGMHTERKIPFFHGNSEEVNIYAIWQKFIQNEHKTKLLIVLCDGQTTGSSKDLTKVIKRAEEDGMIVIGVGVCSHDVEHLYSKYKIFSDTSELDAGLAPYLMSILEEYCS